MLAICRRFACLGFFAFSTGCAMCTSCDDATYGGYGGAWERLDPCYGRVGSAFTPEAGTRVVPDVAESVQPQPEAGAETPEAAPRPDAELQEPQQLQPQEMEQQEPMPLPQTRQKPAGESKTNDTSVLRRPIRTLR